MKTTSAVLLAAVLSAACTILSFAAPHHVTDPAHRLPDPPAAIDPRSALHGPLPDPTPWPFTTGVEPSPQRIASPARGAGYLIVTDAPLVGQFERFAAWKRRLGTPAEVITLAAIRRDYRDAYDDAERIRLAIRDAYARGTRWVLLGGDTEVIPTRIVRSPFWEQENPAYADFPSDYYFACLDGDWNADGDGHFGEVRRPGDSPDDVDLVPEVFVGRAPVRDAFEARVFVDKTIDYAEGRAVPESRKTLFMAEVVMPKPWNGDPDHVGLDLAPFVDFPLNFAPWNRIDAVRLYENHQSWRVRPGALPENQSSVVDHLERGYPLSVFASSGSSAAISVGPDLLEIDEVQSLRNREALTHAYHYSCLTHDITRDCIAEEFLRNPDGGAVTSFGPSNLLFAGQTSVAYMEYLRTWTSGEGSTAGEIATQHRTRLFYADYILGMIFLGDPQLPIVPDVAVAHAGGRGTMIEGGMSTAAVAAPISARPNPARDRVTIEVDLGAIGGVRPQGVVVCDLAGRRLRTLGGLVSDGRYSATWDLCDGNGRRVEPGVYFASIRFGETKRMARLLVVP